ncbi:MAG: efflux RND transporter periplasmic adaptor subunit [Bacteroidota bacterium]
MKFTIKNIKIISIIVLLASCNSKNEKANEEHNEEHGTVEVHLKPEQVKAIGIETGSITNRNLKTSLKVNGKLMLPPQNQAQVSLLIGGIVKDIVVKEGAFVKKGEALATIENTEFIKLQQDFLQSSSSLEYLKAEHERQKELQKENINAAKTFQKAESDYKSELTNFNALKQKLSLYNVNTEKLTPESISSTFTVRAPITGNIHTISINIGTFAEPNKELFDIVDNRYLHIDLTVFEKDISKIHEGQKLTFTDANDVSHLHDATIFSVNKAFEDNQQAVIAHAKIENINETLLPGMFIEARINIDDNTAASLPSDAIVSNGNDHYIFVEHEPNTFRQIQVRTGTTDQNFTEIIPLEEISTGQKVVIKGAYYLLSELTKGEGEHQH